MEPEKPRSKPDWFRLANEADIPSPALLIYRDRVDANLRRMLTLAGSPTRLRPHIKTHKMPALIQRQLELGISKIKCATIAEAEMAAACGVPDVLLAAQPVGPNVFRLIELIAKFPRTTFSTIADDASSISGLAAAASAAGRTIEVLLDLDVGQHRTGIEPGARAFDLYRLIANQPTLQPGGLHVYDGHIHDHDPIAREAACTEAFRPAQRLRDDLLTAGLPVPRVVAGGTPTFPIHARREEVECSPGTCVFWDAGYGRNFPDLDFMPAALLLTRIVSKPAGQRLCLDLGHKAVASEMPHPRVELIELPEARFVGHNEEHLVVESSRANEFAVGDCLYAIPWHVCPTVALHSEAIVVEHGRAAERWPITARTRHITV